MDVIDAVARQLLEATEFIALVTQGADGPHLVGNWGDYARRLGFDDGRLLLPAGRYRQTEENLRRDDRIQVMVASRSVQGTRSPGQGAVLAGRGAILTEGPEAERVRAAFPWARGALVITVEAVRTQL
ncbi:MAG: pyridoxamine 5'-phosphate oxidase family protein [Rhodospirillales bacterium]|nr:pyridoxamine 5'-phosphate oxidase family protein [Rhodospirillales bacterium]